MKLGEQFLGQWQKQLGLQLSCVDRVIFTGYLPFWSNNYVNGWVAGTLRILHKDFIPQVRQLSDKLVDFAKDLAAQSGAPFQQPQGRCRKQKLIDRISRERQDPRGLIAVLCVQESCRTVKLMYAHRRPRLEYTYRPQRVLYFYLNEPRFGRMFVRIQTWFPWRVQIYINGHEWLARQLQQKGIRVQQRDNAFLNISDPREAQRLADRFAFLPWTTLLQRFARQFNPLLSHPWLKGRSYTWVTDQMEYSTDVLFTDRSVLTDLYSRLLDHAVINFRASDLFTFLGRRLHPRFEGEVLTSCQRQRWPGARIKHQVGDNWLKMYDKFCRLLRVETVLNNPKGFKVLRRVPGKDGSQLEWKPLGKSVVNFPRYVEIARSSNLRYLDALAPVQDRRASYQQVEKLTESQPHDGRRYAGFKVARKQDVDFFAAVLAGENHLHGFRTEDIRQRLYGHCSDPLCRRRQANAISRRLKRLHVRELIAKIPRSRRWRTGPRGQLVLSRVVELYYHGLSCIA